LAHETDEWLRSIIENAKGANPKKMALIATGGYGRAQLAPSSDLDLLLVHTSGRTIGKVADQLWYPIWDQGVGLDHSVRTPKEAMTVAHSDLRVALGLLDGRLIWGSESLAQEVLEGVRKSWHEHWGHEWLPVLEEQVVARHTTHGDLADLLEPDLKESHGGLRDLNILRAVSIAFPDLDRFVDADDLDAAEAVLLTARVAMHRLAKRDQNKLLLQDQDEVARRVGAADADVLMRSISEAGRTIARASDTAWLRRAVWQSGRAGVTPVTERVETGVKLVDGEVCIGSDVVIATDASLPLRLAAVAAEHGAPIALESLQQLALAWPEIPTPWSPDVLQAFVRLLGSGRGLIPAVEALEVFHLFTRYLPEWSFVRSYHQRNAYHRFTADRHLLEAVCFGQQQVADTSRPDLLLLGCLFHDIGKGHPGDHTEVGIELVRVITKRMGISDEDAHVLIQLVRHHLLLADAATRRDLDDPATIRHVAAAVGDEVTLELLAGLSQADGLATGSSAWGPWKAQLVADLVGRTKRALRGHDVVVAPADHSELLNEAREQGVVVRLDGDWIAVAAVDQPRLLATITAVLTLAGVNIRSADLYAEDGIVLDRFFCVSGPRGWPEPSYLASEIHAGLLGQRDFDALIKSRSDSYQQKRASAGAIVTSVAIVPAASDRATVLELRTRDAIGLLSRVASVFATGGIDVRAARLSTVGDVAIDTFYVTSDQQALPENLANAIAKQLTEALA
jgi:[protein-PII] uridylyltransferase